MYESISKNNELENEMTLDMSYFWYSEEAYENFMIGKPENSKVRRVDIVQWRQTGWEKVKVKTITRTWNKIGMNVQDVAII